MATDYGDDIGGVFDISADLLVVRGRVALSHAIARRLTTPRGGLFYDLSYGHDVRQYVNAPSVQPGTIESQVSTECLKDERVLDATVSVIGVGEELRIEVLLIDAQGPFRLTLKVTQLTVELLRETS